MPNPSEDIALGGRLESDLTRDFDEMQIGRGHFRLNPLPLFRKQDSVETELKRLRRADREETVR